MCITHIGTSLISKELSPVLNIVKVTERPPCLKILCTSPENSSAWSLVSVFTFGNCEHCSDLMATCFTCRCKLFSSFSEVDYKEYDEKCANCKVSNSISNFFRRSRCILIVSLVVICILPRHVFSVISVRPVLEQWRVSASFFLTFIGQSKLFSLISKVRSFAGRIDNTYHMTIVMDNWLQEIISVHY